MTMIIRPRSQASMARPLALVRRRALVRTLLQLALETVVLVGLFLLIVYGLPLTALATGYVR